MVVELVVVDLMAERLVAVRMEVVAGWVIDLEVEECRFV